MPVHPEVPQTGLAARRCEIEQALILRVPAVPSTSAREDPLYLEAFRLTIPAAFNYSLAAISAKAGEIPPVPTELLTHARLAARHRLGLDLVIRGYVAGSTSMDDFILDEYGSHNAQAMFRSRAVALERLLATISAEYSQERRRRSRTRELQAFEHVAGLLRGHPVFGFELAYDLEAHHVGFVACGPGPKRWIKETMRSIDCQLLLVEEDAETIWGWAGHRSSIYPEEVQRAFAQLKNQPISVGVGESSQGLAGWRQTHRQGKAALQVARRSSTRVARYADVCLVASAIQDPLLANSLREIFLKPLLVGRDGGAAHIQTLRAYFAANRNGESAAASLGISRQAVANRIRVVEERLGRPLSSCAPAVELALRMDASCSDGGLPA